MSTPAAHQFGSLTLSLIGWGLGAGAALGGALSFLLMVLEDPFEPEGYVVGLRMMIFGIPLGLATAAAALVGSLLGLLVQAWFIARPSPRAQAAVAAAGALGSTMAVFLATYAAMWTLQEGDLLLGLMLGLAAAVAAGGITHLVLRRRAAPRRLADGLRADGNA